VLEVRELGAAIVLALGDGISLDTRTVKKVDTGITTLRK
jgi:hypothetical protein